MTQEYLLAIQDFDELKLAVRQVNCIDQLSLSLSLFNSKYRFTTM